MKKIIAMGLLLGIALYLTSCVAKEKTPAKLSITNASLNLKSFNPSLGENVQIGYRLSKEASVSINIFDSEKNLVRTLTEKRMDKEGYNEKLWDGKDEFGNILPQDVYLYVIEAKNHSTNETNVYDVSGQTGEKELALRELNFDCRSGKIGYVLPKAARLRIRIGVKEGGPLLRTLVDWEPTEAGRKEAVWDGMDSSGVLNLLGNENLYANITAVSLPENSIILKGGAESDKRRKRCEPKFDMELLGINEYTDDKVPVVRSVTPTRITLDEEDKLDLINARFEIVFFVDNVFLFEEEEGITPFTYRFDPSELNEGEHVLTVNIYGYNDRISARSKKIFVAGEKSK